jgi:hypothetical protein
MTAFRLVQIGSRDQDRHALSGELGQGIPELAAADRVDTGVGLVEEQDSWLPDEGACKRELLLHSAAKTSGQATGEAGHAEHLQVA